MNFVSQPRLPLRQALGSQYNSRIDSPGSPLKVARDPSSGATATGPVRVAVSWSSPPRPGPPCNCLSANCRSACVCVCVCVWGLLWLWNGKKTRSVKSVVTSAQLVYLSSRGSRPAPSRSVAAVPDFLSTGRVLLLRGAEVRRAEILFSGRAAWEFLVWCLEVHWTFSRVMRLSVLALGDLGTRSGQVVPILLLSLGSML